MSVRSAAPSHFSINTSLLIPWITFCYTSMKSLRSSHSCLTPIFTNYKSCRYITRSLSQSTPSLISTTYISLNYFKGFSSSFQILSQSTWTISLGQCWWTYGKCIIFLSRQKMLMMRVFFSKLKSQYLGLIALLALCDK